MRVVAFVVFGLVAVSLSAFLTFRLGFEVGREDLRPELTQRTEQVATLSRGYDQSQADLAASRQERLSLQHDYDTMTRLTRECQDGWRATLDRMSGGNNGR